MTATDRWGLALHFDTSSNHKRVRLFWIAFAGMFVYEIIPSYIFPLLNGFSIFCLASQHTSPRVQDVFTTIFGGADGNEGLGLFSLSFDWQYITSASVPYSRNLGNELIFVLPQIYEPSFNHAGEHLGRVLLLLHRHHRDILFEYMERKYHFPYFRTVVTYSFQSKSFPMLSTSLFSSNGSIYHQISVFTGPHFQLNQTALHEVGLPALTGSNAWSGLMGSIAIGGLIAHCIFFWGRSVVSSFKHAREKTQPDPHWVAMQKYDEAPWWWYTLLLLLAFFAGQCIRVPL